MLKVSKIHQLSLIANQIRQDIIRMLVVAGSGHTAGPLGMADIFTALYFTVLKHNPKKPDWSERDRLILSNGHICPVQYATLARAGYFPIKELSTLRKLSSRLQGHPHRTSLPGIETTSGPLGSGLSQAIGMALAIRIDGKKNKVYCLMSDGEHQEGQTWEAIMFAGNNKLNNLIAVIDRNNIQITGFTEQIMPLEPLRKKYEAFNWDVIEINGNNIKEILQSFEKAKKMQDKPVVIIANTVPGKGVSFMEKKPEWHGKPPTAEQANIAIKELEHERQQLKKQNEEK